MKPYDDLAHIFGVGGKNFFGSVVATFILWMLWQKFGEGLHGKIFWGVMAKNWGWGTKFRGGWVVKYLGGEMANLFRWWTGQRNLGRVVKWIFATHTKNILGPHPYIILVTLEPPIHFAMPPLKKFWHTTTIPPVLCRKFWPPNHQNYFPSLAQRLSPSP